LDLGLNHVLRKFDVIVPMTAHKLIQVPGGHEGPSGVLVCCEGWIEWCHVDCKSVGIVIPTRKDPLQTVSRKPIIVSSVVYRIKKQAFFILVQSDLGDVFKLTMDYQSENGEIAEVENIRLSYFETLPLATSMCLLKSAFMMLASEDGNHTIYQVANLGDDEMQQEFQSIDFMMSSTPPPAIFFPRELRNLVLVDTIESLSPLIDATVANLTEDDTPQIYALAGRGSHSTFRILRHGLEVSEIAATELPGIPNGIWTVRGDVADLYDSYIIISFVNATLVLSIGESVEEVTDTGILATTPTLSIGQLGQDGLVQVYPQGIRHIRSDRRVSEWKAPKNANIIQGSSNLKQVCIGTSTNEICYFELDSAGNLNEYQERKQMTSKILAIVISPIPQGRQRGRYLAISCEDNTVRIFSLDPNNCLEQVSMQGLSSPAESLVIIEAIDTTTNTSSLFLNMGLANGVLIRTTIDTITGELSDTRQRFLGPKSVKLFPVTIAGGAGVLCLSTRPWLSYTFQSATKLVPMSYEVLEYGSRFASEQSPEGIVAIAGNTLRILSMDKLHQLFNQVEIKLKYTPRRLLLHQESKNFVVIEAENGVLCPSEMTEVMAASGDVDRLDPEVYGYSKSSVPGKWASCVRFLNPFSGDTLSLFELDNNEAAVSLCMCRFLARPEETLLIVGTVTGLVLNPKKFLKGGLRVYRFIEYGQALELMHQVCLKV
jgi:splicing factor 3B subunit 3